jgi:serine/threonine-protein kinase
MAATKPAPSLHEIDPQLPEAVRSVVDRALAFNKVVRWPDAKAMLQAVADAYGAVPPDKKKAEPGK